MSGRGERFTDVTPKQFHCLAGKRVYLHTLDTFVNSDLFDEILLVCHPDWIETVQQEVSALPVRVIAGGGSRQESSYLGLLACGQKTDIVLIHDAVRPFVSKEIIRQNVQTAIRYEAVDTCIPSADTIVHSVNQETITAIPARASYLRGQTPQSFAYPFILQAHEKARADGVANATDDCSLVLRLGKDVHIVAGSEENMKITTPHDFALAEFYLQRLSLRAKKCF